MSEWKSADEISAEVEKLRNLRDKVRPQSVFGDDHRAAIDAQCTVLSERLSIDQVYKTWGDELADGYALNVLDAAVEACDWMTGQLAADEGKPSEGWAELVNT